VPWHTKFGHQIWLKRQSVGWQATPRRGPATAPKKGLPALQRRSGPARQDARTVRAGLCERPRAVGAVRQTRADPCVRWRAAGGRPSRVRGCVVPRLSSFLSLCFARLRPNTRQHVSIRFRRTISTAARRLRCKRHRCPADDPSAARSKPIATRRSAALWTRATASHAARR